MSGFRLPRNLLNIVNSYTRDSNPGKYVKCQGVPQKKLLQRQKEFYFRQRRLGNRVTQFTQELEALYWVPASDFEDADHQMLLAYGEQKLATMQEDFARVFYTWLNIKAELARRVNLFSEYCNEVQEALLDRIKPVETPLAQNIFDKLPEYDEGIEMPIPKCVKAKWPKKKKINYAAIKQQKRILRALNVLKKFKARKSRVIIPIYATKAYIDIMGTPASRCTLFSNADNSAYFNQEIPKGAYDPIINQSLFSSIKDMFVNKPSENETESKWFPKFLMDGLSNITIEQFEKLLQTIKPINLCNYLAQYIACKNQAERVAVLTAVAELYDWFWTDDLASMSRLLIMYIAHFINRLLYYLTDKLIDSCKELEDDPIYNQAFVKNGDNPTIFDRIGLDLTCIPEGCMWLIGGIISIFTIITGGKSGKSWKNFSFKNILKDVQTFSHEIKSYKGLIDGIPAVFNFLMSCIAELFGYHWCSTEDKQVQLFQQKLLEFKAEVYQLADDIQANVQSVMNSPERVQRAQNIMNEIDKIYADLMKQKCNMSSTKVVFDDMRAKLKMIHDWAVLHINSGATKQEPVFIQIAGAAGIGKSSMVNAIAKLIGQRLGKEVTIYSRNSSEQYWSGYNGQDIILYDDWGQTKADEDHADLMKVKNPNKTILNMSDNEEKGRPFVSTFIIGCSNNLDCWSSSAVKSMTAINRRRDVLIVAIDPNIEDFVARYGCPPSREVHTEETEDGEITIEGNPFWIPEEGDVPERYFKEDYSNLRMWAIPALEEHRIGEFQKEVNIFQLVDLAMLAHDKFKRAYLKSLQKDLIKVSGEVIANSVRHPNCDLVHIKGEEGPFPCGETYASISAINLARDIVDSSSSNSKKSSKYVGASFSAALASVSPSVKNKSKLEQKKTKFDQTYKKYLDNGGIPQDFVDPAFYNPRNYDNVSIASEDDIYNQAISEEDQSKVISSSRAFSEMTFSNAKVIGLFGSPGTGKSVAMHAIKNLLTLKHCENVVTHVHANNLSKLVINTPILMVEDISTSFEAFQFFRTYMAEVYDGNTPIQLLICNGNIEMMQEYMTTSDEREMFWRRIQVYEYGFRTKNGWFDGLRVNGKYTPLDIQTGKVSFTSAVYIKDFYASHKEEKPIYLAHDQLISRLGDIKIDPVLFKKIMCQSVPVIGIDQVNPMIHIIIDEEAYVLFNILYTDTSKLFTYLTSGKCTLKKGKITECLKIARALHTHTVERPAFPGTIDDFIILLNSDCQKCPYVFQAMIECIDRSFVFSVNKPNMIIRCFSVVDNISVTENGLQCDSYSAPFNNATKNEYKTYFGLCGELQSITAETLPQLEHNINQSMSMWQILDLPGLFPNLLKIISFLIKLCMSGFSIWHLIKYHFPDDYKMEPLEAFFLEAKGKNKKAKAVMKFSKKRYDQMIDIMDKYGSDTAKQAHIGKVIQLAVSLYGEDISELQMKDVVQHYTPEGEWWNESGPDDHEPRPKEKEARLIPVHDVIWAETQKEKPELPKIIPGEKIINLIPEQFDGSIQSCEDAINNESLLDPSIAQVLPLVMKNMVELGIIDGKKFTFLNMALMIKGYLGVSVYHSIRPDVQYGIRYTINNVSTIVKIVKSNHNASLDLFKFTIDHKGSQSFKSIVHWLADSSYDVNKFIENQFGLLVTPTHVGNEKAFGLHPVRTHCVKSIKTADGYEKENQIQYTGYTPGIEFESLLGSQAGDCGSPLLLCNPNSVTVKILGIHGAANTRNGFASYLYKEFFPETVPQNESFLEFVEAEQRLIVVPKSNPATFQPTAIGSILGMNAFGVLPKNISNPVRSRIHTSPLALPGTEKFFQPAILSPFDSRIPCNENNVITVNPYEQSISKWNHKQPDNVDMELLQKVTEDTCKYFCSVLRETKTQVRLLTKTESLNTCAELNVSAYPRDTSPGYPWIHLEPKKDKYLVCTPGYYKINLETKIGRILNSSIDELIDICRQPNSKPLVCFSASLKDEVVKVKKIFDVNTRSFAGAPFDYSIAHRIYFGAAIGAIMRNRNKLPPQVGIDCVASLDWHQFINSLLRVSDLGFDADFKNWDASLVKVFLQQVVHVYNSIYEEFDPNFDPIHNLIRINLHSCIWQPFLLCNAEDKNTYIIQAKGGMVSGQPGTAMDNSIVHFMKVMYAFYKIMRIKMPHLANLAAFLQYVVVKVYGDDGVYSVHPEIIKIFNFFTFKEIMDELNMVCTPASKDGVPQAFLKVLDFEFLKRKTIKRGAYYMGGLNKESFIKMLGYCFGPSHHWVKEKQPLKKVDLTIMESTMNSCLQEAALISIKEFNFFMNHFNKIIIENSWPLILPSIEDVHSTMGFQFSPSS
ncbi:hypothetical protein 1 [Wuhan spider virus 6]|uniref:hypothetical protein 1 n=1 Tax=Wuhan spider virus 6 TaxID=1923755 RepID=UPI00090B617A|nr:hypothetical protein 1 [Wuhan spider virus 6]APG77415.1 hypothetical protein 1 [Wuhan spider virus 6]